MPQMTFTSGLMFEVPHSFPEAEPHAAALPERPQVAIADRFAGLRRCEEFFFSFSFPQLIQLSTALIDGNNEFGDPYAYRCFANLAESQLTAAGEYAYDLIELLRDYFRACERPMITEGATVCRLFLKLVFGDLVKRIARAEAGVRHKLLKSDPLCGGAFSILRGEFFKAEEHFDRAILDPASRAYGFAGLALIRSFESDVQGALAALQSAGAADDDFQTLAALLER
jgi:hypothetical protein